jgi:hypothetical protein
VPDSSGPILSSSVSGPALLKLARTDRDAARKALRSLPHPSQVQACLDVHPEARPEFLMLLDHPDQVLSDLPPTEFCVTARASGMSEAPWLLSMAGPEQIQACFDLDCWEPDGLARARVIEWLGALVEGGESTLSRGLDTVDPEVLVLAVRSMADFAVVSKEDTAPEGWFTLDGVVYCGPQERVDPALLRAVLQVEFHDNPTRYWQLVYGVLFELESECEEYGLRWRTGRLGDLGFPELEQAMRVYEPLRTDEAPVWEVGCPSDALMPIHRMPQAVAGTLIGEALGKLPPQRAADVLGYVLAVANAVAVTDRLPLSASESIPKAVEKAVRGIDRGLEELARVRRLPVEEIIETTLPRDLFRIGATLDPALRQR